MSVSLDLSLLVACVTFLLAQKSNQKRALCPKLPCAGLTHPSLGKEPIALFWLARAAHLALILYFDI